MDGRIHHLDESFTMFFFRWTIQHHMFFTYTTGFYLYQRFLLIPKVFTYTKGFYLYQRFLLIPKVFTYTTGFYLYHRFLLIPQVFTYTTGFYLTYCTYRKTVVWR
jgi:hypothetical protein